MRSILKSGFLWQFIGGFALGAIGVFTLQPAATETPANPVVSAAHIAR
ncbi:MAG: hypothetical protein V4564_01590 [Pseudomonadota bacterium]|nr:hypothetical protein [Sphingomonas sp. ERG5]